MLVTHKLCLEQNAILMTTVAVIPISAIESHLFISQECYTSGVYLIMNLIENVAVQEP